MSKSSKAKPVKRKAKGTAVKAWAIIDAEQFPRSKDGTLCVVDSRSAARKLRAKTERVRPIRITVLEGKG